MALVKMGSRLFLITPLRICFLFGLFITSLSAAFVSVAAIGLATNGLISKAVIPTNPSTEQEEFPQALSVAGPGVAIHVQHESDHLPLGQKDFLFFVWIKLKRPLLDDERINFVSKYDTTSDLRPGFSIALRGSTDGVRPMVYWQSGSAEGKWYTFSPKQLKSREWYLVALSLRRSSQIDPNKDEPPSDEQQEVSDVEDKVAQQIPTRLLGFHIISKADPKNVELLGGYDVGSDTVPETKSKLLLGSFANGKLRGKIGPFGIIHRDDLTSTLNSLLKAIAKNAPLLPEDLKPSEIGLYVGGSTEPKAQKDEIRPLQDDSSTPANISVVGPRSDDSGKEIDKSLVEQP